jgi:hypothetical protein
VKQLCSIMLLAALTDVSHAQVTCQTYGNTTNCNGSLNSAVAPQPLQLSPQVDIAGAIRAQQAQQVAQQQANSQALVARQQATLLAEQAAYVRQQREALEAQQETLQRQQEDEARQTQQQAAALHKQQQDQAYQELLDARAQEKKEYDEAMRRYYQGNVSPPDVQAHEASLASPPLNQRALQANSISAEKPKVPTAGNKRTYRQKWNALDDALANGVITKAEYDVKLNDLLSAHQAELVKR